MELRGYLTINITQIDKESIQSFCNRTRENEIPELPSKAVLYGVAQVLALMGVASERIAELMAE